MTTRSRRRRPRRSQARVWWIGGIVAAVIAIGGIVLVTRPGPSRVGSSPSDDFPFPCLSVEGGQQHIHPYLRIFVNGEPVPIPASIGIRALSGGGACLEPVHTHDASGIIHIESTSPSQTYTFAHFFVIWRATYHTVNIGGRSEPVSYTLSDFLGHRPDPTHSVQLLVDGKPSTAGPGLVLNTLDYCSAEMTAPPCAPTAVGNPYPPFLVQRYGTGHTIVLQYRGSSSP